MVAVGGEEEEEEEDMMTGWKKGGAERGTATTMGKTLGGVMSMEETWMVGKGGTGMGWGAEEETEVVSIGKILATNTGGGLEGESRSAPPT